MTHAEAQVAAGRAAAEADWAASVSPAAYVLSRRPDPYRRGYHTRLRELRAEAAEAGRELTVTYEVRQGAAGPDWRSVYRIDPADEIPAWELVCVLPPGHLPVLGRAVDKALAAGEGA